MGRVRRQRKFKACDPFSKKKPAKDDTFDRAPTKKELKDDDHFKETASFHKFQQSLDRAAQKTRKGRDFNKKYMTPSDETSILSKEKNMKAQKTPKKTEETKKTTEKLPNESEKQYFDRLDKDIQDALTAAHSSGKTMRKKRKQHLKARDQKKKEAVKRKHEECTMDFNALKDEVKFGERVDAPPNITAMPRKAQAAKNQNSKRGLQLTSLLENKKNVTKDASSSSDSKRRRDMTDTEKVSFDMERQRAIDAYRLSKKRKEIKGMT